MIARFAMFQIALTVCVILFALANDIEPSLWTASLIITASILLAYVTKPEDV